MQSFKISEIREIMSKQLIEKRRRTIKNIKYLLPAILIIAILYGCTLTGGEKPTGEDKILESITSELNFIDSGLDETKNELGFNPNGDEFRAGWITYSELAVKSPDYTAEEYTKKISDMMDNLQSYNMNAVFFHVRAFGDAFYKSSYYPWSEYLTGTQGQEPLYDPLAIVIEQAHARGISVHAWINPYRVSSGTDISKLASTNQARVWAENGKSSNLMTTETGIYYNPASADVQKLIVDGIREIIENYDVDGIHFDDYFYPSTDEQLDKTQYSEYINSGGKLDLISWRKANVNALVSNVYSTIKEHDPNIMFGISTSADIAKNLNSICADVTTWGSSTGYVDYLCPQIYFGFEHTLLPFEDTLKAWEEIITNEEVKLYTGLAVYKCGEEDTYAGSESPNKDTPRYEWINNNDILSRQIEFCRSRKKNTGIAFFSYSYLFSPDATAALKSESSGVREMLS